jgi:hypothetical protein
VRVVLLARIRAFAGSPARRTLPRLARGVGTSGDRRCERRRPRWEAKSRGCRPESRSGAGCVCAAAAMADRTRHPTRSPHAMFSTLCLWRGSDGRAAHRTARSGGGHLGRKRHEAGIKGLRLSVDLADLRVVPVGGSRSRGPRGRGCRPR